MSFNYCAPPPSSYISSQWTVTDSSVALFDFAAFHSQIGDFAILLKSGFKRWDAAVGQVFDHFASFMFSAHIFKRPLHKIFFNV